MHISGLLCAMIRKYWPELFNLGAVYRFQTPIMKAIVGKSEEHFFYNLGEFEAWATKEKRQYKTRYLKGLGSSTAKDFETHFKNMDSNLIRIEIDSVDDLDIVDLVFGKETGAADKRKLWLDLE